MNATADQRRLAGAASASGGAEPGAAGNPRVDDKAELMSMRAAIEAIAADPKLQGDTRRAAAALLK